MLVYRICNKNEIDKILIEHNFNDIGYCYFCNSYCKVNNHKYIENDRYLHFFSNKMDILYLINNRNRYIGTYAIPDSILDDYVGYGNYYNLLTFTSLVSVKEYAIPCSLLNFSYLKKVEYLNKLIDIFDVVDENMDCYVDTIYENNDNLKVKKFLK